MTKSNHVLLIGFLALTACGVLSAQTIPLTIQLNGPFWNSTAGTGDLDGGGLPDLAVADSFSAGIVVAYSTETQSILWTANATNPIVDRIGWRLDGVGDVNGDGTPDVAAGDIQTGVAGSAFSCVTGQLEPLYAPGKVRMISGADGSTLWSAARGTPLEFANTTFGRSLKTIGDVNGDGTDDLVVAQSGVLDSLTSPPTARTGAVWVLSGVDGSTLRSHPGSPGMAWPTEVIAPGDMDGDGVGDYAAAGVSPAEVRAYSGATGAQLWQHSYSPALRVHLSAGRAASCSGLADVVLQTETLGLQVMFDLTTRLLDGRTGVPSWSRTTTVTLSAVGLFSAALVADDDGDGAPDLVITEGGVVRVLSSATGSSINTITTITDPSRISDIDEMEDIDGNGTTELLVLKSGTSGGGVTIPGEVDIVNVGSPVLLADFESVGTGCGPNAAPPALSLSAPPRPGSNLSMFYEAGSPGATAIIALGAPLGSPLFFGNCQLWIDPGSPIVDVTVSFALPPSGSAGLPIAIPDACNLNGLTLRLQGFGFPVSFPGFVEFTAGYDLTFGF